MAKYKIRLNDGDFGVTDFETACTHKGIKPPKQGSFSRRLTVTQKDRMVSIYPNILDYPEAEKLIANGVAPDEISSQQLTKFYIEVMYRGKMGRNHRPLIFKDRVEY